MATAKKELQEVIGEVQRPMSDYVFPNRARDYTPPPKSTASIDLARMGKQAGLLGAGFLPGAGVADYFGQFPAMEGGKEPSAVENFQQGNYGTAALQGLGAMGDLALTVPVAGMAVGSVLKAPRAAQKMLQELPKVDELGFYSQVEKAVMDNPQQKGTGAQFLAQIQKTPGVKAEELQYTGLDKFLASKPTVTKAEIQDYLDTNKVQVQEVRLVSPNNDEIMGEVLGDIQEILEAGQVYDADAANFLERYQSARLSGRRDRQSEASIEEYLRNAGDNRTIDELAEISRERLRVWAPEGGQTKYHLGALQAVQTEIPGGQNYREVLLTLPAAPRAKTVDEAFELWKQDARAGKRGQYSAEEINSMQVDNVFDILKDEYMTPLAQDVYRSSHFDQPNILAHMRLNDRVVDGKNTLFIEEIQSDWHQAGRKKGYDSPEARAAEQKKLDNILAERQTLLDEKLRLEELALPYASQGKDAPREVVDQWNIVSNRLNNLQTEQNSLGREFGQQVPDAPFKTSWDELTLKRAIKLASDEGYDQIAFTTGRTQADRYGQTKKIESVALSGGDFRAYDKSGKMVIRETGVTPDDLSRLIGPETAEKLLSQSPADDPVLNSLGVGSVRSLLNLDLSIGGEGMKGFYDKMLPKKLEKLSKRYGAKVEKTTMDTPDGPVEIWAMQLPDELKETVSTQGQPLFQLGAGAVGTAGIMSLTGEDAQAAQEP